MAENRKIHLEIVTPYDLFYTGEVDMLVVTAKDGEIGVLPGHTVMFAALRPGELRAQIDGNWRIAAATQGYVEISPEKAIVVVNAAEWVEDIDVARAKGALGRAEARLADPDTAPLFRKRAETAVERAHNRLKIVADHLGKKARLH